MFLYVYWWKLLGMNSFRYHDLLTRYIFLSHALLRSCPPFPYTPTPPLPPPQITQEP